LHCFEVIADNFRFRQGTGSLTHPFRRWTQQHETWRQETIPSRLREQQSSNLI